MTEQELEKIKDEASKYRRLMNLVDMGEFEVNKITILDSYGNTNIENIYDADSLDEELTNLKHWDF